MAGGGGGGGGGGSGEHSTAGFDSYIVVHNVAKRHNIGTLARSATAFGVRELVVVGRRDFSAFGAHGAAGHSVGERRLTPPPCVTAPALQEEKACDICGVEIADSALPVSSHSFRRSTAFILGNEGQGLMERELAICDFLVYIPQYGFGTASLNVTVAASIVIHHFAGFVERQREGQKYVVAERPLRQGPRNAVAIEDPQAVAERRQSLRAASCNEVALSSDGVAGLFALAEAEEKQQGEAILLILVPVVGQKVAG
eukprot:SM000009S23655  [mRNA]  locus=s9:1278251:1281209:- [translate_table: standard]